MKLKKFEARTENEAIEKIKNELGEAALILSVKKKPPTGFFRFFKKPTVEVTAAFDDKDETEENGQTKEVSSQAQADKDLERDKLLFDQLLKNKRISEQQKKIENLKEELAEMAAKLSVASFDITAERIYDNSLLQLFHEELVNHGVLPEIACEILKEAHELSNAQDIDLNIVTRIVYNKIFDILSKATGDEPAKGADKQAKILMLMGPTGVGKTTTIAKLSSNFILGESYSVGLITADTYRIAAVEQLKTYADILGINVGVVYEPQELNEQLDKMISINDIIIIDTAGRSHKNKENFGELIEMINSVSAVDIDKYLVLSLTTKYEDLLDIVDKFSDICQFDLIFTKLDETLNYGSILNICYKTGKKAVYLTTGQNVPDDIEKMEPAKVTKALLGLEGVL